MRSCLCSRRRDSLKGHPSSGPALGNPQADSGTEVLGPYWPGSLPAAPESSHSALQHRPLDHIQWEDGGWMGAKKWATAKIIRCNQASGFCLCVPRPNVHFTSLRLDFSVFMNPPGFCCVLAFHFKSYLLSHPLPNFIFNSRLQ